MHRDKNIFENIEQYKYFLRNPVIPGNFEKKKFRLSGTAIWDRDWKPTQYSISKSSKFCKFLICTTNFNFIATEKILPQAFKVLHDHFNIPKPLFCTIAKTYATKLKNLARDTLYFCFIKKNFNLSATVEDIVSGQYNFHTIIFACKKINEKSSNLRHHNLQVSGACIYWSIYTLKDSKKKTFY